MKKGKILRVGRFNEQGWPRFWQFDCGGESIPAIDLDETGTPKLAGWTMDELRAIADVDNPTA